MTLNKQNNTEIEEQVGKLTLPGVKSYCSQSYGREENVILL